MPTVIDCFVTNKYLRGTNQQNNFTWSSLSTSGWWSVATSRRASANCLLSLRGQRSTASTPLCCAKAEGTERWWSNVRRSPLSWKQAFIRHKQPLIRHKQAFLRHYLALRSMYDLRADTITKTQHAYICCTYLAKRFWDAAKSFR